MFRARRFGCSQLLAVYLALSPAVGATGPVQADEETEFRRHYERALRAYKTGHFQDAIKEFQDAYAIRQLPRLLLNLGQVHRRLGHARDALGYYEFYLRVEPSPEPKLKAELDRYIAQTRAMLEAAEKVRREARAADEDREPERMSDPAPIAVAAAPPAPAAEKEPPPLAVAPVVASAGRGPRPRWRVITGLASLGVGLGLAGAGSWALAVDGACAVPSCGMPYGPGSYQTQGLGIGLVSGGAGLVLGGVLLLALPGPARAPAAGTQP